METVFLVIIVVLGAALVVLGFAMLDAVKGLKASVTGLEKKVSHLQAELARQQENLEAVTAVLHKKPEDPFASVLQAVDRYRSRGFLPAVVLVGARLFRSYLNGRARRKALPVLDKRTE